ncbi:MAG: hypothetical protein E6212_02630 [Actinomyces sp.]|nr:hypothetical protein [Actinomyces sp.]
MMLGCAVALTAAACLGLVILISGMVAEVLGDIRDRRRREATNSSSSAERCRACSRGVCALRSADEDSPAERGDAR